MVDEKSLTKNTSYLTLAFIFQKILSFGYFSYAARLVGAEEIGAYVFALSFTTVFSIFIDLGISQILIREIAKAKEKLSEYLSTTLVIRIALAILVYGIMVLFAHLLGYSESSKQLIYLAGIIMVLDSFILVFYAGLRAFQNLFYESFGIIIWQTIIVGSGLFFLSSGKGILGMMIALILGIGFNFVYSIFVFKKKLKASLKLKFDKKIAKKIIKIAWPFFVAGIFIKLYASADILILSRVVGQIYVGWYSIPMKIVTALQFIPAAFAAAMFPAMSHLFAKDKSKLPQVFEKAMFFLMLLSVPIALGIFSLADQIILKIYTAEFAPSILSLQIVIFGMMFIFLEYPLGSLLNACNKQTANTINRGIMTISNIVLNLFLIPYFHFIAASGVYVFTIFLFMFLNWWQVNKILDYNRRYLFLSGIKIFLAGLIMMASLLYFKQFVSFLILVPVGAVIYFGVLWMIRGIGKNELSELIAGLKGK